MDWGVECGVDVFVGGYLFVEVIILGLFGCGVFGW